MNTFRNIKTIIGTVILAAIAFLAKSIGAFLTGLGSIPVIGIIFKILAFPFNLIGKLQKIFIILLVIMIFLTFVLPVIKKIIQKIKHRKAMKVRQQMESQELNGMINVEAPMVNSTGVNSQGPSRMNF